MRKNKTILKCVYCEKDFLVHSSRLNRGQVKFCSRRCYGDSKKGKIVFSIRTLPNEELFLYKQKMSNVMKDRIFTEEHKNNLKGHVPWNRGKTYNILRKLKGDCNLDYDLILFFYDLSDTDSKRQGYVLDALSENKTYDFRIFSLDRSFSEDPLLEVVKKYYNITMSPTLVINENKTDGFTPIDEIINKL